MYGCNKEARAYVALVCPHLEYCSPVRNPHLKIVINLRMYRNGLHVGHTVGGTATHTPGPIHIKSLQTTQTENARQAELCCPCVKFIKLYIT